MIGITSRIGRAWRLLRSIRVRLTLWYVALLAVILLAFSAFLYVSLSQSLHAEVERTLTAQARQIAATLDLENGQPSLNEGADGLPDGTIVALYDATGTRLIVGNTRQPLPALSDALAQAIRGQQSFSTVRLSDGAEWRVLVMPVVENGRTVAVLQVARSERDVEGTLGQLVALMAVAIPLILLLASAGGLFLARQALAPVDRITRLAEQIGAEDLSRRLNLPTNDELGRLAATFDRMLDRLDHAFQRQRQFAADASHELRTPLTMLTSQVDVTLERRRTVAEYRQALASVREDATRMGHLLGELLALARADAGQEGLVFERVNLSDLADDVVAAMTPLAKPREVRLERTMGEGVDIEGDQTRLMQLLVNFVDNGLKYTPAGGAVTVTVDQEEGHALLRVADTGVGIAPEHLPHLFERFYRVDKARSRAEGGAGLGLAISQWIVRAHGGTTSVTSQPGRGTTFTVMLPLAQSATRRPERGVKAANPRRKPGADSPRAIAGRDQETSKDERPRREAGSGVRATE